MRWSERGGPPYNNPPYYLSAYGLAVKHGFKGTEEEYLASLKGETGGDGSHRTHRSTGADRSHWRNRTNWAGWTDRRGRSGRSHRPHRSPGADRPLPEKPGQRDRQARQEKPEPQVPRGQWGPRDRQAAPPARQDLRGPADRPVRPARQDQQGPPERLVQQAPPVRREKTA